MMLHPEDRAPNVAPFQQWLLPDGGVWARFYRIATHYLVSFPGLADFAISCNGLDIETRPAPGVARQTIAHLYANQVVPLALSRQLKLVLHAGAIELGSMGLGNSAIAFAGVSGRGKSTLTASFATSGYRFLSDDGLQLEKNGSVYLVHPSHPSIRLWDDSRQALVADGTAMAPPLDYKCTFLAGESVGFCPEPRPLRALYFLGDSSVDRVDIQVVSDAGTLIELVRHSFLLDIDQRQTLKQHFVQLVDLVKTVPCYRLDYPRDYAALLMVRKAVTNHVLSRKGV